MIDDPVIALAGRREICAGRLQEAYGIGREEADRSADAEVRPVPVSRLRNPTPPS